MLAIMAWRNLWRRPLRTGLSLVSIILTTMLLVFMLSFQLGIYDTMKSNALRLLDGFAQIQPPGYLADPDIRKTIAAPADLAAAAIKVPGITAAAPRATTYVILSNGELSYGGAVIGVDPQAETQVSRLKATVHKGRYLTASDSDAIVLGDVLARNLKVSLGDRVTLLGSSADGGIAADSLRLVGLFHTGMSEIDRQVAEMPLARFQDSFGLGGAANIIALSGPSLRSVQRAQPALRHLAAAQGLVLRDWAALEPALQQGITLDFSTSVFLYTTLVIVVVFIILNTLLMSVLERTREFGMLLALGMRPMQIGRLVWMELLMMSVLGNGIGATLGALLAAWFQMRGIVFPGFEGALALWGLPPRLYPTLSWTSALSPPVVMVVCIALAGTGVFLRLRRLEPVPAMRAA